MLRNRCFMLLGAVWIIGLGVSFGFPAATHALVIASDNAGNAAYSDGWTIGDNGGSGFGAWAGNGSYGPNPLMEIDTTPAEGDNDLGAPAFRIGTGGIAGAGNGGFLVSRPFTSPMQAGQSFQIDFDGYPLNRGTPPGGDLLLSFHSASGERVALYGYFASDGASYTFGTDNFGINAISANNNLAGGASLPPDPLGGIDWQSDYTYTDSSDGFSLTVDVVTIDTYRVRIVDDNVTKLDISGQMYGGATTGEGLNSIVIYGSDINYDPPIDSGRVAYFNNMQIIGASSPVVAGDYNNNGLVDAADYVVWRKHLNSSFLLHGEKSSPGTPGFVDQEDYAFWRSRFGANSGSGSGLDGVSSIPEPSSFVLSVLGLNVAVWRRRARRFKVRECQ